MSATRLVIPVYFLFLLLSFSSTCQALYGGLPTITKICCCFCRSTLSVFFSVNIGTCFDSANSKVSTKQIPGNGLYSPTFSKYACSMFMLAM